MKKKIWIPLTFLFCCWMGSCHDRLDHKWPSLSSLVTENPFFKLLEVAVIKGEMGINISDSIFPNLKVQDTFFAPTHQDFTEIGNIHKDDLLRSKHYFFVVN